MILGKVRKIYDDIDPNIHFPTQRPILAHYTSLEVGESILRNSEIWLSNPLFMNDYEELSFGLEMGKKLIEESTELKSAFADSDLYFEFISNFLGYYDRFEQEEALNVFVACLSMQNREDEDGILSMWRGYGHNGKGIALIFDSSELTALQGSPLTLAPVHYASTKDRVDYLSARVNYFCSIISKIEWERRYIYLAAFSFFQRILLYSIFTKHIGFAEENEWRIVYLPSEDKEKILVPMIGYHHGPRGIEPKMRLKIEAMPGVTADNFVFENIIHSLLLGPTGASKLAESSFKRMLQLLGRPELVRKVRSSKIPFRPTPQ